MVTFDVQSLLETFFEEAEEHLVAFEQGLLVLETDPKDAEVIARIFRAAHSIKGASGTFGLVEVSSFTHALETLLDRLRQGELVYDAPLQETLLESLDMLKALIGATRIGGPAPAHMNALREALLSFAGGREKEAALVAAAPKRVLRRLEIWFRPKPTFMSRGMDPAVIVRELRTLGEVHACELDVSGVPPFGALEPTKMHLAWRVVLSTPAIDAEIDDIIAFVDDLCTFEIRDDAPPLGAGSEAVAPPGPAALATADVAADKTPAAAGRSIRNEAPAASPTIRVATEKVDKLLDLVGELVIAQAMIVEAMRSPEADSRSRLTDAIAALERHTRELQERVMSIRMVPLSTVFQRFPRLVHDTAAAIAKKVRLQVAGEGTEIDKSMVEKLVDPITHLVRNAIDHGLESPAERLAAGKPEEGTVTLAAFHQDGNVVIEVSDDGHGLDTKRIRAKAERMGLTTAEAVLTDEEVHEFILRAGFSTAASLSDLSGRGVGMDVVKRNVELLNGSLALSTEAGRGTRVKIRLPLTLAILDGLAVRVGTQTFIVPLLSVVESFRPKAAEVRGIFGRPEIIDVRGTSLPIVSMRDVLGVHEGESDPCKALICVVETNGGRLALLVDDLVGQLQVVVKSLETNFRKVEALMGATIMGDGRVAMIVDVHALARGADHYRSRRAASMTEPVLENA